MRHPTPCQQFGRHANRDHVSCPHELPDPRTAWIVYESMLKFLLWLILFVVCWPLALLALLLYPLVWVLLLPFRLVGIVVDGVFEFLGALIRLPARALGGR